MYVSTGPAEGRRRGIGEPGMCDGYAVTYVEDEELPTRQNWVLATIDGRPHVFVRRSAMPSPVVRAQLWAALSRVSLSSAAA